MGKLKPTNESKLVDTGEQATKAMREGGYSETYIQTMLEYASIIMEMETLDDAVGYLNACRKDWEKQARDEILRKIEAYHKGGWTIESMDDFLKELYVKEG